MLDKDRVTELVVQSGLHEFGYGNREKFMTALAYFATALQHEVLKLERGDAEPVAWQYYDKELGKWFQSEAPLSVRKEFEAEGYKTEDLFERRTPSAKRKKI